MIVSSWVDFIVITQGHLVCLWLYAYFWMGIDTSILGLGPIGLLEYSKYHQFCWVFVFALQEKIIKERFIINHTNESSRKRLIAMIDRLD